MRFLCPKCGHHLQGERDTDIECPSCKASLKVNSHEGKPVEPDTPEAWRIECELAVRAAATLLKLAKRNKWAEAALVEIIRTAPAGEDEHDPRNCDVTSLLCRVAMDAKRLSVGDPLLDDVFAYFDDHLRHMPPARRAMLEASLAGSLTGLEMA
jgi:uncharacterized Zn finger protein (UPF0148 family)